MNRRRHTDRWRLRLYAGESDRQKRTSDNAPYRTQPTTLTRARVARHRAVNRACDSRGMFRSRVLVDWVQWVAALTLVGLAAWLSLR